jgi:protein-tyrosine phosphatase
MRAGDDRGGPGPSSLGRALSSGLRHPWTMAAKGLVKDAVWLLKGRRIENPALPATVTSVLFVCLGNICRSPFAEQVAARRFAETGATTTCASAGITARQSGRVPPHGRDVATADYGISLDRHEPQRLTREMVDAFDLVVVMEAGQLLQLRAAYPHATQRLVLLSLLDPAPVSPYQRYHIDDPFGQPRSAFGASFSRIDRAVSRLVEQLALPRS